MKNFLKSRTIQAALIGALVLILVTIFTILNPFSNKTVTTANYTFVSHYDSGLPETKNLNQADCWTHSISSDRPDAYRCSADDIIYDPCFVNPFYDSVQVVDCPDDPSHKQSFLVAGKKLSYGGGTSCAESICKYPWYIRLDDGTSCRFLTGGTNLIAGKRIDYSCDGSENIKFLLLPITKIEDTSIIACYKNDVISDCKIRDMWF